MNIKEAEQLFGIQNEHEKVFFAQIPRCVILDKSIPMAAKNIYYYLIARCDQRQGPFTWVSQKTIAEDMQLARQNVNANIKTLERFGLIQIKKTPNNHNVYLIKNVAELYGEFAGAPWQTKNDPHPCHENMTTPVMKSRQPPVMKSRQPPVMKSRQPPVMKSRHKEEEVEVEEIQEEEKKTSPNSGGIVPPEKDPMIMHEANNVPCAIGKKKKAKTYDQADLDLANKWLDFAKKAMPWKRPPSKWDLQTWALAIKGIRQETGINHAELEAVLEFIKGDSFWTKNALSPANLLKQKEDGLSKFDRILMQIKGGKDFKSQRISNTIEDALSEMGAK